MDTADSTDVKAGTDPSPAPDVKDTAQPSSGRAGAATDSPPAKKASDTPTPPPGTSNREALIASLSQDKKEETTAEGDEPEAGDPPPATDAPATDDIEKAAGDEGAEKKPDGDDTEVTAKPERAKKDTLIENLRKVSAEKKALEPFQRFSAPILTKLQAAKIPPAEFHQLTDTFINARAKGVAADKLAAWVELGTENLSGDEAGQRLYEMAVQHGYKPTAPAVPVVSPEDEAYIAAQRQAGLIDDEMAARMRKMAAKMPPAPAPKPRQQPPPQQRPPPPAGDSDVPTATVEALDKMGSYADAVKKQHKITDADWPALDAQIIIKLNKMKAEAGGHVPVNLWHSSFKLAADAVVSDFLQRKAGSTRQIQTSLRPSKAPGAGADANLSEREKTIRRISGS
jgi:hypothetical protein